MRSLVPPRGGPETLYERLHVYVAQYAPEVVGHWIGSTDAQIAEYARAAGFGSADAVPLSFRSYLHGMGGDDGNFFRIANFNARAEWLVELYADWHRFEPAAVNPELPVAATLVIGDQISSDLRAGARAAASAAEPSLADTANGHWLRPRAPSWESLVMRTAMLQVECRRLPHVFQLSSSPASALRASHGRPLSDVAVMIDDFAAAHDLALAWPNDGTNRIAINEHHSIFADVAEDHSVLIRTFSDDAGFSAVVARDLGPALGCGAPTALRLADSVLRPEYA